MQKQNDSGEKNLATLLENAKIYLIWLIILFLVIFSYVRPKIPFWLPVVIYLLVLSVRIKEKIGNYKDWARKNKRDEKIELDRYDEEMAGRGLSSSGERNRNVLSKQENFEDERKIKKRRFWVEFIDCLFLK